MNAYELTLFIQSWLLPPGLIILMIILGLFLLLKWQKLGKGMLFVTLVLFYILSTPFFAQQLFNPLESIYPIIQTSAIKNKDAAIIILGAGVNTSTTMLRVKYAAAFAQRVPMPIITSGGNKKNGITEAEMMRSQLHDIYNLRTLAIEDQSKNTEDEAKYLLPILNENKIKTIYLVTNAFHMPRSMMLFKKAYTNTNIKIVAAPMGKAHLISNYNFANYLPQAHALNASEIVLHEYLGLIWTVIKT